MPLYIKKQVEKGGTLGIWHITETLENLIGLVQLSPEEVIKLATFAYEQRKKEYLTARILCNALTEKANSEIIYDVHSKPFLKNSQKHISISHSHDFLTIILSDEPTGIDIELIKHKIEKIKHKFMSDSELKSLQGTNHLEQLTTYWCAKESLYKLYGKKELTFKENLSVETFQSSEKGMIKAWIKTGSANTYHALQYEKIIHRSDHYMITYIINQD